MRVPKLPEDEITRRLAALPDWTREGDTIRRAYRFPDFARAVAFVNAVAEAAEEADHHPDIDIRYSKVTLALTTHDARGLTANDMDLAARADRLA